MNRLQLATLLSWADEGGFQGRKRLQKVAYFLQAAGCPLDCQFILHHYGPYSRDVADACDELVAAGLVSETGGPTSGDMQYTYSLRPEARTALKDSPDEVMRKYRDFGTALIKENLWLLELGSTIRYFHERSKDWDQALAGACEFKKVQPDEESSRQALALAKRVSRATQ